MCRFNWSSIRTLHTAATLLCVALLVSGLSSAAEPEALQAEATKIAREQLQRFGKGYTASIDPSRRLIFVSALDDKHLRRTVGMLAGYADALRKELFNRRAQWNITIVLPTADDYKPLAPRADASGFYRPADHTLISVDRGRVLLHEFTHALHHADAAPQMHPIWIAEGLAALYENCNFGPTSIDAQVDWRLPLLQEAIRTKKAIPLHRLLKMDRKPFLARADLCYAQARYLMLYLQQRNLLRQWYQAYKAGYEDDATGRKAIESQLKKNLFAIESDWHKWVGLLKAPWGEGRAGRGRLGLRVQSHSQGVKVMGFIPGSTAEKAGRIQIGDVITKFNGHRTGNPGEFVGAVQAAGANQTVKVELLRHGRRMTVMQTLGAPASK